MRVDSFFPVEFFSFQNDSIDNRELISKLENLPAPMRDSTCLSFTKDIHNLPEFNNLFSWIRSCIHEMKEYMTYDCDSIDITTSWYNVYYPGKNHYVNYHRHSMSFYSGVYYLTDGSVTTFEDPVFHRVQAQIEVLRKNIKPFEYITPEPGKLVLFPSWMFHASQTHLGRDPRYIISFNTLPCGEINYNLAAHDSRAAIEIKDPE